MKTFSTLVAIIFLSISTFALGLVGSTDQFESIGIITFNAPDANIQYFSNDEYQIIRRSQTSIGWISDVLQIPSQGMKLQVIGANYDHSEVYLLDVFTGRKSDSKVYTSKQVNGLWTIPEKIKINGLRKIDPILSATVSNSGDAMILSLNDPRRNQGESLYVTKRQANGEWSWPVSLPKSVNSQASEFAPSFSADGTQMFFVSDRAGGFGGTDIYVVQKLDDSYLNWSNAKNAGNFINTAFNEYGYYVNNKGHHWVNKENALNAEQIICSTMQVKNIDVASMISVREIDFPLLLKPKILDIKPIDQLTFLAPEKNLLFNLNSVQLTAKAKSQLKGVATLLTAEKTSKLKITGYSCDLGPAYYNLKLSKERAQSTVQFMVDQGIEIDRITYEAKGESNLLSRKDRALNRRVNVKVQGSVFASN